MPHYCIADLHLADGTRRAFYYRANSSDQNVIRDIFQARQYDVRRLSRAQELFGLLERQASAGRRPLIVDAGANIGASTVHFMTTVPTALVVAVEPDVANFELLLKNAAGPNVQAVNAAISSTRGHARVFDPGEGHWGYRTRLIAEDENLADAVPRVTINDIYNSHSGQHFPYIVKVDIEGGESDLFSGNTEWVARTPLVIVELHDWLLPKAGTSRPFLECISKLDRDFVQQHEDIFSIANDLDSIVPHMSGPL
jgi:FkbM family methyltransferase